MEQNSNISEVIINTINKIIGDLFTSIDINLYKVLDKLAFIKSDILKKNNFEEIFGTSALNGILLICNSLLIGFIIYYAIKYFSRSFLNEKIENPWQFVLKIIVFGICMNCSYFIMEFILDFNSNISIAIRNIGEDIFKIDISFTSLIKSINNNLNFHESINLFSIEGLIKGTFSMSLINLLTVYALRYVMVKILVLLSPLAFLSLSTEKTSWIFKTWGKVIASQLVIQIVVSIVLLIMFSFGFTNSDIFSQFIYLGGIYALIKANSYAKEFMMGSR